MNETRILSSFLHLTSVALHRIEIDPNLKRDMVMFRFLFLVLIVACLLPTLGMRSHPCPAECVSDSRAEKQCARNKFKENCSVVKCGKTGAGRSKCIKNKRAAKICPEVCISEAGATRRCGLARWVDQCQVADCGNGKVKCTEKPRVVPKVCNVPSDDARVFLLTIGTGATYFAPSSQVLELAAQSNKCIKKGIEANATALEGMRKLAAALIDGQGPDGEKCIVPNAVTDNADGSCTVESNFAPGPTVESTLCMIATFAAIDTADPATLATFFETVFFDIVIDSCGVPVSGG